MLPRVPLSVIASGAYRRASLFHASASGSRSVRPVIEGEAAQLVQLFSTLGLRLARVSKEAAPDCFRRVRSACFEMQRCNQWQKAFIVRVLSGQIRRELNRVGEPLRGAQRIKFLPLGEQLPLSGALVTLFPKPQELQPVRRMFFPNDDPFGSSGAANALA